MKKNLMLGVLVSSSVCCMEESRSAPIKYTVYKNVGLLAQTGGKTYQIEPDEPFGVRVNPVEETREVVLKGQLEQPRGALSDSKLTKDQAPVVEPLHNEAAISELKIRIAMLEAELKETEQSEHTQLLITRFWSHAFILVSAVWLYKIFF